MNTKAMIIINYILYGLVVTIPIAIVISVIRYNNNKKNNVYFISDKKLKTFIKEKEQTVIMLVEQLKKNVMVLKDEIIVLQSSEGNLDKEIEELTITLSQKEKELKELQNIKSLHSYGFYETEYDSVLLTSEFEKLSKIDSDIKDDLLGNTAYKIVGELTYANSKEKGLAFQTNMAIYMVRAFVVNVEEYLEKMNKNNYDKQIEKIEKLVLKLEKANSKFFIKLNRSFINKYITKAKIYNEYIQRLEEERLAQIEHDKLIKEQRKLAAEEEKKAKLISSEVEKNSTQLDKFKLQLENNPDNQQLLAEIATLEEKNKQLNDEKIAVETRLNSLGAGYIYVISNIGSFGENIYKIGFTRRRDPHDRVKELSGASVPFVFDVHALIYDENASSLETKVHTKLNEYRVNKENNKKEFFEVDLDTIKNVLTEELNKHVEFMHSDKGKDYYESLRLSKKEVTNEN